jgi:hypothetical protein
MTPRPHRDGDPRRTSSRYYLGRHRRVLDRSTRTPVASGRPAAAPRQACTEVQADALWERHGQSAYAIACVLLGDAEAAARTVELGMADLAGSPERDSPRDPRRSLAQHIYRRSQELSADTPRTLRMPPPMEWISRLAQLQRACLALCLFGGHTHREAAALLDVPPTTVAALLTSGLTELGRLAAETTRG